MITRMLGSAAVLAAVIGISVLPHNTSVSGQARATPPPLVITAFGGEVPDYRAPRTPWGDPDLQGVWSSDDMEGTQMSRAAQFEGRLYRTPEEMAARARQVEQRVNQQEQNAESTFRFDFARRAFPQTSLVVDPPDGRQPALVAAARGRQMPAGTNGRGPLNWTTDFPLYERCITRGIAGSILNVIYGNGNRIVQSPGTVAFSYEMLPDTRLFYTDDRPRVSPAIQQYLGVSRARWEGEELVVETTNLTDRTAVGVNGLGTRHSDQMVITERFRRVAEDIVQYQATFDDPLTYERPFTISFPLTPLDGGMLLPYECHSGNRAIEMSLGAERLEDRTLAEQRQRGVIRPRVPPSQGAGVGGGGGRGRGAGPTPVVLP